MVAADFDADVILFDIVVVNSTGKELLIGAADTTEFLLSSPIVDKNKSLFIVLMRSNSKQMKNYLVGKCL